MYYFKEMERKMTYFQNVHTSGALVKQWRKKKLFIKFGPLLVVWLTYAYCMTVSVRTWAPLSAFLAEWELPGCLNPCALLTGQWCGCLIGWCSHETRHLLKFYLTCADCKVWMCTECVTEIYVGPFLYHIQSICIQHFHMNDLYAG